MATPTDLDASLAAFLRAPDPALLSPAALRLGRRLPAFRQAVAPLLQDPLDRALCGLGPVPAMEPDQAPLDRAVLAAVARWEGEEALDPAACAALEARARGDGRWWPLAAQVHAAASPAREVAARKVLSEQDLPYVFPGELHEVQVDVLAVGARVMPALHVDWARKLTDLVAEALVLDVRQLGLWFWPVLRSLPSDRLPKPVLALAKARRLPPGGLGLAAAYAWRVGAPWEGLLQGGGPADALLAALAIIGDRRA